MRAAEILFSFVEMTGYYYPNIPCNACDHQHSYQGTVKLCKWCKMPWGPPFDQHDPECKLGQAMDAVAQESNKSR